ncbi:MAG: phage tail tape measure protein, partial [Bacteroidota bacterium]
MALTGSLSSARRGAPGDTLLEIPVGFRVRKGARDITSELTDAQEKSIGKARKRQEQEQKKSDARSQKAQEELIERRRRLAVAAIKDETKRRRASIEAEYNDERRRIKALLRERLDANDLAAKDYKRQLDNFDRDLRARRDRQLSAVPADTLRGRANQLLGDQFGGRAGALGGLVGARGAAAIGGGIVVGAAVIKGINEAVAAASAFEDELVEVRKTTGLTKPEVDALGAGILDLAQDTGIAQNELAAIAAVAGQLGIQGRDNLLAFTKTVAQFAAVTELSNEQAAESLAKTGRAFGLPVEQLGNLASAANELSNTTAARAGDIIDVLQRVGASGTNIGLTADEVAALAATLIDAGVESERAGTSLRNQFTLLLTEAGKVADTIGISEEAFRDLIDEDALGAIELYLGKLNELDAQTRAIEIEKTFGQENVLQVTTLAAQVDQLNTNLDTSREAFETGTSLSTEFNASLDALSAQWAIFTATITKAATGLGNVVLPALTELLKVINRLTGGGEDAAETFLQADADIGRLRGVDRAIDRYEELAAKTERTSEENDELRRITKELAGEYPQFVSATDSAGNAMRVYSDDIRAAAQAVRELRVEEQLRAVEQLGEGFLAARRRRQAASDARDAVVDERQRSPGDRLRTPLRAG